MTSAIASSATSDQRGCQARRPVIRTGPLAGNLRRRHRPLGSRPRHDESVRGAQPLFSVVMRDVRRITLFGIAVDVDAPDVIVDRIMARASAGIPTKVYYANAHVLNLAIRDPALHRSLCGADVVLCDGFGVRLAARWLGLPEPPRAAITDCIWDFADKCARTGISSYILAGAPGVAARAARVLRDRYPGFDILGTHDGYVAAPDATADVVATIRAKRPGAVCIGMGTPTQEHWIDENFAAMDVPVAFAVGAVMDYVSGEVARPRPTWMSEHGLEWVTRLVMEPRRMWRRYLIGNPTFLHHVLRARLAADGPGSKQALATVHTTASQSVDLQDGGGGSRDAAWIPSSPYTVEASEGRAA